MRKKEIATIFDKIYINYDRANTWLSLGVDHYWRRKMAGNIRVGSYRILDACCGTGSSTYSIFKASGRQATVFGIDFSKSMLKKAQEKYFSYSKLKFFLSDVLSLDFEDNYFDTVAIAYGIRNITDRERALKEFLRVTKPGGRLICMEFGYPQALIIRWGYNLYLNLVLVNVGGFISGNRAAYAYLVESIKKFPPAKQFMELLQAAGYKNVEVTPMTLGICNLYTAYKG